MKIGIIGGGASGMAAAIWAAQSGNEVLLFERQSRVGRKLLATGNGRCNLTNKKLDFSNYHGEDPNFAKYALDSFHVSRTLRWFDSLGLYTVTEESGRVYPYSDQANSVVDVLRFALQRENVQLLTDFEVIKARKTVDGFLVESRNAQILCDRLIIACGGLAGTKLGGTMSGYQLLRSFGHHVTRLRPALVQVKSSWQGCASLKGVRANCHAAIYHDDKLYSESTGELQFTQYGLSGPVIFEISRDVCQGAGKWVCKLDFIPDVSKKNLEYILQCRRSQGLPVEDFLTGILHNRLGRILTQAAQIRGNRPASELTDLEIHELSQAMKGFEVSLTETLGMDSAQVTAGGILTSEFNPETLESRLVPGLYACGEVLDIDGDCGGFNLQWAWSSGALAGTNAGGRDLIRIRDISLSPEHNPNQLLFEAAKMLKISGSKIKKLSLVRRSIDARKKPDVRIIYTVDVSVDGSEQKILRQSGCKKASIVDKIHYKVPQATSNERPVVVGFGPAGMFAALVLAIAGLRPIVLERGEDAKTRHEKVSHFFTTGELDTKSNVQFGEGGAGTFSDGKLNTGVNNIRISWILEQFVKAGAAEDILFDAKPHIGTDVLLEVVQNIRQQIISLGGEVHFNTQVTGICPENGLLTGLETNDGHIPCNHAIFAIGHSARDTFTMLQDLGVKMEPKPFSMGVRIEHKQTTVDTAQYGSTELPLPPADYKLVKHLENETVYTFCMCPGGYVVAAASEEGGVVTNGMSYADRGGENANAALLVTLNPEDFPFEGVLGGMHWQRQIEQRAFAVSNSYHAPAQLVGDFLAKKPSVGAGSVTPTYQPGVVWCDLHDVLPEKITRAITEALPQLDRNLKGFSDADAVLTAPETRSSSPVRILRDETRMGSIKGFYPSGEGAGYAGGIISAAIDGMMSAEALIAALNEE